MEGRGGFIWHRGVWLAGTHTLGRAFGRKESAAGLLIFDIIAKNDELPILRYLWEAVVTTSRANDFLKTCLLDEDVEAWWGVMLFVIQHQNPFGSSYGARRPDALQQLRCIPSPLGGRRR